MYIYIYIKAYYSLAVSSCFIVSSNQVLNTASTAACLWPSASSATCTHSSAEGHNCPRTLAGQK